MPLTNGAAQSHFHGAASPDETVEADQYVDQSQTDDDRDEDGDVFEGGHGFSPGRDYAQHPFAANTSAGAASGDGKAMWRD